MKKIVLSLVALLLLLLIGGAAGWWYFLRPAGGSPAAFLPAETLLFAEIPDGVATLRHYQSSPFRRLMEHPAVQALLNGTSPAATAALAQAAEALPATETQKETLASTFAALRADLPLLLRGDSFLALTTIADEGQRAERIHLLLGFHRKDLPFAANNEAETLFHTVGTALAEGRAEVPDSGTADYNGVPYTWLAPKDGPLSGLRLCRARVGEWDLIAWGDKTLFDWIDRAAGRTPKETSLLASKEFLKAMAPTDKKADLLLYSGPDFLSHYAAAMEKIEKRQLPAGVPNGTDFGTGLLRQMFPVGHGAAGSFSFTATGMDCHTLWNAPREDRKLLETIYQPKTRFESTAFTSPTTLYFQASSLDIGAYWNLYSAFPPFDQMKATLETQVKGLGFDYRENLIDALGGEFALVVDWPANQDLPDVLFALGVKSADKFTPLYNKVTEIAAPLLGMFGTPEAFTAGDYHATALHLKMNNRFSPTLFDGPHFWGLSLRAEGAKRLLSSERATGAKALTQEAILGPLASRPTWEDGLIQIGWVRAGELASRGVPLLRAKLKPLLAAQPPQNTAWVGKLNALPDTATFLPLLGEWRAVSWSTSGAWGGDAVWTP